MQRLNVFGKIPRPKLGEEGLIQVIMMMGLVSVIVMSLLAASLQSRKIQINSESKLSSDILQQNFSMYVQDNEAWKNTMNDPSNQSFACLRNGTECSKSPQPIKVLRNGNNEIVVDTDGSKGVLPDGTVCSGYTAATSPEGHTSSPASACNIHVGLTWTPLCKGLCMGPSFIQVNVSLDRAVSGAGASRFIASNGAAGVMRIPFIQPKVTQIGVGKYHTCALAEGAVYCWGDNSGGQLGLGSSGGNFLKPQKVTGVPLGVTQISVGMGGACVIQGGNVWCWGWYFGGTPRKINDAGTGAPLAGVIKVSWQLNHGCAITSNGAAYCWGSNMYGQLGYKAPPTLQFDDGYLDWFGANGPAFPVNGLSQGINGPNLGKVTEINTELNKTFAVVDDGTNSFVMEWGNLEGGGGSADASGDFFYLGISAFYDIYSPLHSPYKVGYPREYVGAPLPGVSTAWDHHGYYIPPAGGTLAYNIGKCNPIPEKSDYKTGGIPLLQSNVKSVLNSYGAKCFLLNDGDLVCAGGYDYGRHATNPPNGDKKPHLVTTIHGVEMLGSNAAGFFAIKNGELWAWGFNNSTNPLGDPAGGFAAPYWGSVWQPFKINLPSNVTYVAQGGSDEGYHMCAVVSEGAFCWGRNNYGQLGDGGTTDKNTGNPVSVINWP